MEGLVGGIIIRFIWAKEQFVMLLYTYPTGKIHIQLPTNSMTLQTSHQI